jgi:hypothetical protein
MDMNSYDVPKVSAIDMEVAKIDNRNCFILAIPLPVLAAQLVVGARR